MGKSQPSYTKEFKQQAVQLFETSGKTKTQLSKDLGISDSALSKWCREFGGQGEEAFPGKGHQITKGTTTSYHFPNSTDRLWCSK